jgi:PPM family protein phosphatase
MGIIYCAGSQTGSKRPINEDSVGVFEVEDGILAIVCDGIGGKKAGDVASKLAVSSISSYFISSNESDYSVRIKNALCFANDEILKTGASDFNLEGMATTADSLFIKNGIAYWGHVGDSRIYMLNGDEIYHITKDHSLVQKLVDDGLLTQSQAERHPNKNIITRAVGDDNFSEPDFDKLKLDMDVNWKFLLCTDGISSVLNDNVISSVLCEDMEIIQTKIIELVEYQGSPDNYSYVVISNGR